MSNKAQGILLIASIAFLSVLIACALVFTGNAGPVRQCNCPTELVPHRSPLGTRFLHIKKHTKECMEARCK